MAAGKYGAQSAWLLVNGYNLIPSKLKNLAYKVMSKMEETTGLGDSWQEFTPVGLGSVSFTAKGGFFDTTATTGAHAALKDPQSSPQATAKTVCLGFAGNTAGEDFIGFQGALEVSYGVMASVGSLSKADAEYLVTGRFERGQIIQPLATKTADWNTDTLNTEVDQVSDLAQRVIPIASATKANPCVVTTSVPHGLTSNDIIYISSNTLSGPAINGERTVTVISETTFSVAVDTSGSSGAGTGGSFVKSDSIGGAAGYLQVTACSGFTNFVLTFYDSADNSTYASLIAMTDNVSAPFAERKTVSGRVDRYVVVDGNITGTGSVTCLAGLARL